MVDPPDGETHGKGNPPESVLNELEKYSKYGIVCSGVVAWIDMHRGVRAVGIWREAAIQGWSVEEVTEAKGQLSVAMGPKLMSELKTKDKEFKLDRKGSDKNPKQSLEFNDIITMLVFLSEKLMMPLILASSDQLQRCPQIMGSVSPNVSMGEMFTKMQALETVLAGHLKENREQMAFLTEAVLEQRRIPERTIISPISKTRRVENNEDLEPEEEIGVAEITVVSQGNSYRNKVLSGIQPLVHNHQQQLFTKNQQQKNANTEKTKKKNIFHGSAKTTDSEDQTEDTANLAADVDLVAFNISKQCTEAQLQSFLEAKSFKAELVECLTREELLKDNKVRSKTMKVTFKASELEKAMNPDMWPFRVGVRHYKPDSRRSTREGGSMSWQEQSAQSGGRLTEGQGRSRSQGRQLTREQTSSLQVAGSTARTSGASTRTWVVGMYLITRYSLLRRSSRYSRCSVNSCLIPNARAGGCEHSNSDNVTRNTVAEDTIRKHKVCIMSWNSRGSSEQKLQFMKTFCLTNHRWRQSPNFMQSRKLYTQGKHIQIAPSNSRFSLLCKSCNQKRPRSWPS